MTDKPMPGRGQNPVCIDGVIYGCDAEVAAWMADKLEDDLVEVPFVAMGVVLEGSTPEGPLSKAVELVAGAYFFNYEKDADVTAAVATDERLGNNLLSLRHAIRRVLLYPFRSLRVPRVSAEIDLSNERSIRNAQMLGFVIEGRKRKKGRFGGDVAVLGLTEDDARRAGFFWDEHEQPQRSAA